MKVDYKQLGNEGEKIASDYLESKGYKILVRNFKTKLGEIDITAKQNKCLVFVEVKTSYVTHETSYSPEMRVDHRKQNRLRKLAELYFLITETDQLNLKWRIDVISVRISKETEQVKLDHFINAVGDRY